MRSPVLGIFVALLLGRVVWSDQTDHDELFATPSVAPSQKEIPANFLKFYLTFPQPMERGDVFRYLILLKVAQDGTESEVLEPFREIELWDESFTTLTLWLHPGRQKTGVNLNVELGPILEEGHRYALVVSEDWKFESGLKRKEAFRHEFFAVAPDLVQPDPADWTVDAVSETIVKVETQDSLDPYSLAKRVALLDGSGRGIDVEVVPGKEQFLLSIPFQRQGWIPGEYQLVIDPRLEDLAGNSVARPFALDLGEAPDFVETTTSVAIDFSIPSSPEKP